MLQWQRGLPGGLQLAEETLLCFTDAKHCKWAVIVMSFEEGHTVEDMVDVLRQNRGDDLLEIFACDVAYPTMQALADLHEAGLAHCDWKPANLVLHRQPGGNVLCKPIDFGFARICRGEPQYYYRGTETFLSPELLENRWQLLLKQKISTAVNPHSADVYANGVMLTILLRSALRQELFAQFLFEPPPWYEGLLERQRVDAHLAGYRRALQYRYEKWSPLAFLSNFRLPADCQDFLMHQLVPQSERATAAELISHPFLKRMAARRRSMQKKAENGVREVACNWLDASGPAAAPVQEAMYCREGVSVQEMGRVALPA
ncbi:kinase-like protein [Coccomyxa subellipsoidea C-169]|uniref:Kinase-like protein n=1 Tax=Coccomyxa subellipsoidea (strain C-169) TaxID=574566 RepID=I0YTL9_COCSC|nr:kinase-like protein [Coccomyxa subellipsoidea C-169]EIE21738.1 kinase-like protein [Coccomyxa subellipsoidea C-169]|eukprot:XP_005646282.1 kinase-like protein [Coccomyxa subellipsoidea C-169]